MADTKPDVAATVLIATKNRKDELLRAVASATQQEPPVEVLVMDDGSDDGTAEAVRVNFPGVRVERSEQSLGYIVQRNRGIRMARGGIVFSLDDDAFYTSPDTVRLTLEEMHDSRVAAVAIPLRQMHAGGRLDQRAPDGEQIYLTAAFIGAAFAIRRDVFVQAGGFREDLFHQGEESDLCIRLLDQGFVTRMGSAPPIEHRASAVRNLVRMDYFGRRNDVLFAWWNVPFPELLLHLAATAANGVRHGMRVGRVRIMVKGLLSGLRATRNTHDLRSPVSRSTYRTFRRLRSAGATPMAAGSRRG